MKMDTPLMLEGAPTHSAAAQQAVGVDDNPTAAVIAPESRTGTGADRIAPVWAGQVRAFSTTSHFLASGLMPDIVVWTASGCRFAEIQASIRSLSCFRLLIIFDRLSRDEAINLMRSGVLGLVPVTATPRTLQAALSLVADGQGYAPPTLLVPIQISAVSEAELDTPFSAREAEVAPLIAAGFTNKEIARQLGLQEVTIKVYASGVFRKLGVSNRTAATAKLLAQGVGLGKPMVGRPEEG